MKYYLRVRAGALSPTLLLPRDELTVEELLPDEPAELLLREVLMVEELLPAELLWPELAGLVATLALPGEAEEERVETPVFLVVPLVVAAGRAVVVVRGVISVRPLVPEVTSEVVRVVVAGRE